MSFAGAAKLALAATILAASLTLAACSDENTAEIPPPAPVESATPPAAHSLEWLRLTDAIAPEQWLASREAGRDLDLYDPAVADMRRVLEAAAARFRDQPRMIANRAVQLEGMLKEKRIAERAPQLIVALSQVPGGQRSVESFAGLTQQYYNLRLDGLSRADAVDALRRQATATR